MIMKRITPRPFRASAILALVLTLGIPSPSGGQTPLPRANFVRLVVPEADTVRATSGTYRLSAGTLPGNKLTINGVPLKVYPSGAAAGLLNLGVGENSFRLTATGANGDSVSKSFVVIRAKPP